MTMIITNNQTSFTFNTEISKSEMFRIAQEKGFTGGKTSFMNLINGKVSEACGFFMQEMKKVEQPVSNTKMNKEVKLNVLASIREEFDLLIKDANTETYGTFLVGQGRVQISPLNNGEFSVMVFPKKGYVVPEVAELVAGSEAKSQYVKMPNMDLNQLRNLGNILKA